MSPSTLSVKDDCAVRLRLRELYLIVALTTNLFCNYSVGKQSQLLFSLKYFHKTLNELRSKRSLRVNGQDFRTKTEDPLMHINIYNVNL